MAKPKITRLGDPANPYTKKKVTAEQARASAKALGVRAKPKPKAEKPASKKTRAPRYETLLDRKMRKAGA